MEFIYIFVAIFVIAIIAMFVALYLVMNKVDSGSKSGNVTVTETQKQKDEYIYYGDTKDFVPVVKFEDNALDLGNYNFRAIIEVSSVNYDLVSPREQDIIESSFRRFLNMLRFPITMYVQTRVYKNDEALKYTNENVDKAVLKFPGLKNYAELYREYSAHITEFAEAYRAQADNYSPLSSIGPIVKKKYIIVPFSNIELKGVTALSSSELRSFALDQLMGRCKVICNGLVGVGLGAKILNRSELAECLYAYYHRDNYKLAKDIIDGYFGSLIVDNEYEKDVPIKFALDTILQETQNRIKYELYDNNTSAEEMEFLDLICNTIQMFKQNDKVDSLKDIINLSMDKYNNQNFEEVEEFLSENPDVVEQQTYDYGNLGFQNIKGNEV